LAGWLVRALQHERRSFGSVREALAMLDDLIGGSSSQAGAPAANGRARVSRPRAVPMPGPAPVARTQFPRTSGPPRLGGPAIVPFAGPEPHPLHTRRARWILARRAALILLATGFSASIGASHYQPPANAPNAARAGVGDRSPAAPPEHASAPEARGDGATAPEMLEADILLPPGWIEVSAPVDMTFLEGGATIAQGRAGRLAAKSGLHDIEVVNHTLGFRETRRITVRPGGVTRVVVQLPFGIVDLNAKPWAEVWLDGQRVGETPIGNLSVPIGPHEFVFRHPEFGERRHAVSLTTAEPIRLSVDMTRQ
jgi:hypothetical protein